MALRAKKYNPEAIKATVKANTAKSENETASVNGEPINEVTADNEFKGYLKINLVGEDTFENIPNDITNIISDIDTGIMILEGLSLVNPNITAIILNVLDTKKSIIKLLDFGKKEAVISSAKILIRKAVFDIAQSINQTQSLNIPTDDIKNILDSICHIFPEVKFKKSKRIKPSNKAFKIKQIEATPNHTTSTDILALLIKPFEFTDNSNNSKFKRVDHSNKKNKFDAYTELAIPKPEKIDIGDATFNIVRGFDWKDRKILRLIFTEALHHKGSFSISLRWVLEKIGELKTGGKTLEEKLEDLKERFKKYRLTSIRWKYKLGKKIEGDSITGGDIFLLNFEGFYDVSRGNKPYDIVVDNISLGHWFEINRSLIKEFTRIPEKLLSINTHRHWISFAIGEKICVLLRIKKENILNSKSAYTVPIKLKIKTLLDEIIPSEELKGCLENSWRGSRLKAKILEETKYLEDTLNWQFNWVGLTDNLSFNDFYNKVSFEAITDSELESEILGEKLITEIVTPKPKSNLTVTDLITALETHEHNRKVSIRKLTTLTLNKKHPWLQKRLDPNNGLFGKLTQKELEDCLNEIERLTKKD
jgi:hypothetical protein